MRILTILITRWRDRLPPNMNATREIIERGWNKDYDIFPFPEEIPSEEAELEGK